MKDELIAVLEAMRLAQAELAACILPGERNAEITIAKLKGILENRQVLRAMRHLCPTEDSPSLVPGDVKEEFAAAPPSSR
jgi:hypothetical protein